MSALSLCKMMGAVAVAVAARASHILVSRPSGRVSGAIRQPEAAPTAAFGPFGIGSDPLTDREQLFLASTIKLMSVL